MSRETDWKGAWTLDDYVVSLFKSRLTEGVEFQALLRVYGRERMTQIWDDYKKSRGGGENAENGPRRSEAAE